MSGNEYRLGYRGDIEGLRAVAILLVVAVHAGVPWLSGGFVGVDVFFVLSGFLITGLLVREMTETGRLGFGDFYVRRLRRLLPALLAMLLVTSVAAALLLSPNQQRWQASAAGSAALWLSNVYFSLSPADYFAPTTETNLFLHTWSLGVEEQFYLLWPALLIWLLGRNGHQSIKRLKVGMLLVAALSLATCVLLTYKVPQLAFYMMPMRAWQFSAGALIWLYFQVPGHRFAIDHVQDWTPAVPGWCGWLGLSMIVLAGMLFKKDMAYPGAYALLPTLGAACVIAGGSCIPTNSASRLLSWLPLQAVGRISYAWYLWHWPVLLLGQGLTGSSSPGCRAICVVFSLVLAVLSYRYIESPVRKQQWWLKHRRTAIAGTLAAMVLTNVLCLQWYQQASNRMRSPEQQRYAMAQSDAPVIYKLGCDNWYYSDRVLFCAFGTTDAKHTVVLMGDSIAAQWFPAVARVFGKPGWRLLFLTKSSCPMVDEPFFYPQIGREYTVCSTWREHALIQIAALKPDVVVLSSASTYNFSQFEWMSGTTKALQNIAQSAGRIYILRGTPHLPFDGPECLAENSARPAWLHIRRACIDSYSDPQADRIYRSLQLAASRFGNVSTVDMNNFLCPNGVCAAEQRGAIVFRDSQHMTAAFAESLGPSLEMKLNASGFKP